MRTWGYSYRKLGQYNNVPGYKWNIVQVSEDDIFMFYIWTGTDPVDNTSPVQQILQPAFTTTQLTLTFNPSS